MQLSPSAHVDTFTRDNLPPVEQWPEFVYTLPQLRYPQRLNCAKHLFDDTVTKLGADRPCLLTPDALWTYGDLSRKANQIARVLVEDLRLVPGQRVLLRSPNNPWLVACWLAVVKAGCVAVTTVPMLRESELRVIGDIARPNHSLVDHRLVEDLAAADVSPLTTFGSGSVDDLVTMVANKPGDFETVETAADDVAILSFTSGTTGRPKGAMHFHRDVLASIDTYSRYVIKPQPTDVFAGSPPIGVLYGLCALVTWPLAAGASIILLEKGTPDILAPALAKHRASVLFTAPTAYRAMLENLPEGGLPHLRLCVSAGEPLPKVTWDAWYEATGTKLIDGIGSTEMNNFFITGTADDVRPGSTGKPLPGYVAALLDEDGKLVPDGEPGRLAVKGPTGCRYLTDPRQTDYVQNGWNITGDTYVRDAEGYYWYQARSDDIIVSAGFNISGPEVEQAILSHPDVAECGVIGVPHAERTMIVKAYVVLRPGVVGGEEKVVELQDHCKKQISSHKCPRQIDFLQSMPRTGTGKIRHSVLREMAAPD